MRAAIERAIASDSTSESIVHASANGASSHARRSEGSVSAGSPIEIGARSESTRNPWD